MSTCPTDMCHIINNVAFFQVSSDHFERPRRQPHHGDNCITATTASRRQLHHGDNRILALERCLLLARHLVRRPLLSQTRRQLCNENHATHASWRLSTVPSTAINCRVRQLHARRWRRLRTSRQCGQTRNRVPRWRKRQTWVEGQGR